MKPVLETIDLKMAYRVGKMDVLALRGLDITIGQGEYVAIMGPSGCGKSTLLHIVGGMLQPTSGRVLIDGEELTKMSDAERTDLRRRKIGFVFQDHCLIPQCSVLENVLTPTLISRNNKDSTLRARELLTQVGLSHRLNHRPGELSGGEKQRVSLARALITKPRLLLCDEPTGNLDHKSAEAVASLLFELHQQQETILIVVTHNSELAARFPTRYELIDQQLQRK